MPALRSLIQASNSTYVTFESHIPVVQQLDHDNLNFVTGKEPARAGM